MVRNLLNESTVININIEDKEDVIVATSVAVTEILDALGVKVSGVPQLVHMNYPKALKMQ